MPHHSQDSPDDERLSVVHVCAPAAVGGLERVVQGLSSGLASRGHDVSVLAAVPVGTDLTAFFSPMEASGVRCVPIEGSSKAVRAERRHVLEHLRGVGADVLHTHGFRADVLHGGPARSAGVAAVTTLHGYNQSGGRTALFEWLQLRAIRSFDAVVAVSEPLHRSLRAGGVPDTSIHRVPNGWTPPDVLVERDRARERLGLTGDELAIGWVGRMHSVKGCDVFLDALEKVEPNGWVGIVIGDGPEEQELKERARTAGLSDRVRFLGSIPDAASLFRGLDLFVLSSRSEGTPMALLEAMGAERPVVVTAVGGVPAVVPSESEGWVVPGEDPVALGAAISAAVENEDERIRRAKRGLEHMSSVFDFDGWIDRHESVYRSAVDARRAGRR